MSKYIDFEELESLVQKEIDDCKEDLATANYELARGLFYITAAANRVVTIAKNMPPADVAEVKHGEWINPEMGYEDCSVCGYCFAVYDEHDCYIERNFCPNCGADMRKRRETE